MEADSIEIHREDVLAKRLVETESRLKSLEEKLQSLEAKSAEAEESKNDKTDSAQQGGKREKVGRRLLSTNAS